MSRKIEKIDVICQHSCDGSVIPLRVRVTDEEGERHIFTIKEYKNLSGDGAYTTPDGVYVTNDIMVFDCTITVFEAKKQIRLYYEVSKSRWAMVV